MKIIIVRHAETTENAKTKDLGHGEALLTEQGILQAQKLGKHLKDHKITHAYSSPQRRAVHTAEEIIKHQQNVAIESLDDLREQDKKGGETREQLQMRAKKSLHKIIQRHKNDTVLVVSHGGTLGVLLLHLLEKELTEENYRAHQPKNTEFTVIEITDSGEKKIHVLNGRHHLDEKE